MLACALLSLSVPAFAQQPLTADDIMARVAANQDKTEAARAHFVYTQHVHVLSRTGKTIRCEETTDTRITPTPTGSQRQLLKLEGRLLVKHKYETYTTLPASDSGSKTTRDENDSVHQQEDSGEMDQDLVENLRANLLEKKSADAKDGIAAGLFPLTSKAAPHYIYRLLGREPRNGRDCFHISFHPKDDEYDWKGDAWIDANAFQPVVVRTALYQNIPLGVRIFLGTSVPGLGFTVIYAPQPANAPAGSETLWFPTSFGTEFKIHILFFLNRQIVLSADNRDFEQTHVTSVIRDSPTPDAVPPDPKPDAPNPR
jgi:hypothetical protein